VNFSVRRHDRASARDGREPVLFFPFFLARSATGGAHLLISALSSSFFRWSFARVSRIVKAEKPTTSCLQTGVYIAFTTFRKAGCPWLMAFTRPRTAPFAGKQTAAGAAFFVQAVRSDGLKRRWTRRAMCVGENILITPSCRRKPVSMHIHQDSGTRSSRRAGCTHIHNTGRPHFSDYLHQFHCPIRGGSRSTVERPICLHRLGNL